MYKQYQFYNHQLRRAFSLIQDDDERKAVDFRYMQGYSYKEALLFCRHGLSDSTIRRKILDGTESMAITLKLMGFFEQDNGEF